MPDSNINPIELSDHLFSGMSNCGREMLGVLKWDFYVTLPPWSTILGCWDCYSNLLTGLFFSTLAPTFLPPHRGQICPHSKSDHMCARVRVLSPVQLFVTLWAVTYQAPLSMGFTRQEYWSRLPCPPQGDLPNPGIKPLSLTSAALGSGLLTLNITKSKWYWILRLVSWIVL